MSIRWGITVRYLLDILKDGFNYKVLYAYVKLKDCFIYIDTKSLEKSEGEDFNNITNSRAKDSIVYNEQVLRLIRNKESHNVKPVETILAEMKSARGIAIGYLVIDNDLKLNIRSCDEMMARLKNGSIICTNGIPSTKVYATLNTLDIINRVKDEEITKEEISNLYIKYKDNLKVNKREEEKK